MTQMWQGRARALRRNLTDAEQKLWRELRNRQLAGYKFRRQVVVGKYFVDFLCPEKKLIVEVDGGQHADSVLADECRTSFLESQGYKVVRFWNNEVLQNIEGVLETLTLALSQRERG